VIQGGIDLAAAGIREGEILAGKYRIERILGAGGMGAVVAAHHLQLDSKVAIKFLLPDMLMSGEAVARFANEARRSVKISSDHVARVYDVGALENGAPYMVMEYLEGADLRALLRERGPLPLEDTVDFLLQAMEAIAEAHSLGIVHRDLKPANLYCIERPDGRLHVKVLDFGISKATDPVVGTNFVRTMTSTLLGSPFYMSPEQMDASAEVDARTDVWALGVILFELLAARVPFEGATIPEISIRIATRPPAPLRDFRPDVPEALEAVVSTCLEKNRERRFGTVADLALALLPFAPARSQASVERIANTLRPKEARTGTPSAPPRASYAPTVEPRVETISPTGRTTHGASRRVSRGLFAALGGLLVAGGATAGVLFMGAPGRWSGADAGPATGTVTAALPDGGATALCIKDSTRCDGRVPETCANGQWVAGEVTAGQCDAECTPGESPPQCKGTTPQACDKRGQWVDRSPACPYACKQGVCVGLCVPNATECSGTHQVRACGADGEWEAPSACGAAEVCRSGVCVRAGSPGGNSPAAQAASPPSAPSLPPNNCDPNYTLDAQGQKHFKPECFPPK
jgi:eukaryotic-like serine/threonine-protein kinase